MKFFRQLFPDRHPPNVGKFTPIFSAIFLLLFFSLTSVLLFGRAMNQPFSHDEHQFVASAKLFTDFRYLPYRDFPYHHMPYQIFIYGLLFKFTRFNLLAARAFSVLCAVLSTGILFFVSSREFQHRSRMIRYLFGVLFVVLLITSPLYSLTSGKAWNHDLPTLLILIVFLLIRQGFRNERPKWLFITSGLLLGVAIGTRLTYVFSLVPFLGMIYLSPYSKSGPSRYASIMFFSIGVGIAMLPAFILFLLSPEGFIFGNYVYPRLHTVYQTLQNVNVGITIGGKIAHFTSIVFTMPLNLLLYAGYILLLVGVGRYKGFDKPTKIRFGSVGALIAFLLIGAFIPTPSLEHYFYAPIPFLVLGILLSVAKIDNLGRDTLRPMLLVVLFAVSWHGFTTGEFEAIKKYITPGTWVPVIAHELGREVSARVDGKLVLTLAPLIPLEGEAEIYKQFVTGPFTWRVASLLSNDRQQRYQVISEEGLADLLAETPPEGILVGFEAGNEGFNAGDPGGLEKPLVEYASEHGYVPHILPTELMLNEITLWVR